MEWSVLIALLPKFGHSLLEQKSVAIALLIKIDGSGSYAAPDLRSTHWLGAARSIGSVSKLLSETALSVEANLHRLSRIDPPNVAVFTAVYNVHSIVAFVPEYKDRRAG